MIGKTALLVPLALTVSVAAFAQSKGESAQEVTHVAPDWVSLGASYRTPEAGQVRIEQRVIVRIAPRSRAPRTSLMAELPQEPAAPRLIERKMDDCVAINGIVGVQTSGSDKLILYMRDRRMVSAKLERSCRARDFYSGFYIEENDDGRLCVKRDKLQSRSGANCEVERLRQLIADND